MRRINHILVREPKITNAGFGWGIKVSLCKVEIKLNLILISLIWVNERVVSKILGNFKLGI
jgi:hypothetical protein